MSQENILDALPDMCFILTPAGDILRANRHAVRVLGRPDVGLVRMPFVSLLDSPSANGFGTAQALCRSGAAAPACEATFSPESGHPVVALLYVSPFPSDADPSQAGYIVIARDISEQKKRELDLLRFSNVAHFTVNPIEITDAKGRIVYVNPAFEKASGYPKEEIIGRNPSIFGSGKHPPAFWKRMWDTIYAGKVWVGEVENRRRTGEPYFTQLLISPIVDGDGQVVGYFGVHRDVSEQRQLEQQLIHAQKMESIGLLAAGIAHEVGNPLTSISSLVQVIQRTTADEFTQEKLELIKSQVMRISRIIRDLVDFSRRSSYEVQVTDVNKVIREAVEIVRVGKKAKEIAFAVSLSESAPYLRLVPDQIEQVFINILINAVDAVHEVRGAAPDQGRKSRGEIGVRSRHDAETLTVQIQDNGKGIPDEAIPKVFEPFFTTKKVGEGTGLGLWVSYGIVKSFGGNIAVKSVAGEGTLFTITLPLVSEFH